MLALLVLLLLPCLHPARLGGEVNPTPYQVSLARRRALAHRALALHAARKRAPADDVLGLSLASAKRIDWRKALKVARVAGPAIAVVYPPAAPFVAAGLALAKAAENGDGKAIAKIVAMKAAAKTGDPRATQALQALETAKAVRDSVRAANASEDAA